MAAAQDHTESAPSQKSRPVYSDREYHRYHQFKKNVVVGYADILAVGCRALLGLKMGFNYHSIVLPELSSQSAVKCQRPTTPTASERYFEPFQILDCKYEEYTLVIINTEVPADRCHYVVNYLLDMCRQSQVLRVIVLSCLRTELTRPYLFLDNIYFENNFYMAKLTRFPSLPADTPISDPLLNILLQMFKAIKSFQQKLSDITGLEFDLELSTSLMFEEHSRCHTMMGFYS
ncbi:hypothetical protein EB796_010751 [Bugula neritina]|uniref:Uncharacterized protein n=1 Tax=Bugula neritina TaxID=10212 RepID=A0A7J7JY93_BUGNE|nr:hypothetical protein EB796_010751 [Bugula neritina]